MIQRIQTLLLFLVLPVNAGFYFTPMFTHAMQDPSGWLSNGLIAALFFSAALSVYAIFLYHDRSRQIDWVWRALLFQMIAIGAIVAVFFTAGRLGSHLLPEALALLLPLLAVVLQYLAVVFIRKDEDLVRSMDRIR